MMTPPIPRTISTSKSFFFSFFLTRAFVRLPFFSYFHTQHVRRYEVAAARFKRSAKLMTSMKAAMELYQQSVQVKHFHLPLPRIKLYVYQYNTISPMSINTLGAGGLHQCCGGGLCENIAKRCSNHFQYVSTKVKGKWHVDG
jgi:hypothetical protein